MNCIVVENSSGEYQGTFLHHLGGVYENIIYCSPTVKFPGPISGQNAASENITEGQRQSFTDFNP
jgi:hypothetical protein